KLNKPYKKLLAEQFLPKDRPLTELDEKINSRRIKQALDAEYVEFTKKSRDKANEALSKIVTKSAEDIYAEKIQADKLALKDSLKNDSMQKLLEYFEEGQTVEQLLNKMPSYIDASPKARALMLKEIQAKAPRNVLKQKEVIKKIKLLTPAQQDALKLQIESTIPVKLKLDTVKAKVSKAKISKKIQPLTFLPVADLVDSDYEDVKPLSKTAQAKKERAERVANKALLKEKKIQADALKAMGSPASTPTTSPVPQRTRKQKNKPPASPPASPIAVAGKGFAELTALIGKQDQYNMGKASIKSNELLNDADDARRKSKKLIIPTEDLMNVQRYENARRIYKNV
ncbi:MAG: hypothetical protein WCJ33_06175, partial [Pseudomonadota bacterium]